MALALAACSGSGDADDEAPGSAADCDARCAAKYKACGHAPAVSRFACPGICGDATESQLQCAEAKSCDEFNQELDAGEAICGISEVPENSCPALSGCECGVEGQVLLAPPLDPGPFPCCWPPRQ